MAKDKLLNEVTALPYTARYRRSVGGLNSMPTKSNAEKKRGRRT